ncbi:MAG TPA: hypothetical protein DCE23_08665 [Firmicutes bacterium]|nr:hypothetical protein [Bacillota bacterium]
MFKENKFTTILFILLFTILIGVLAYTPFYLKEYKETLNKQHQDEKVKEQEEKEKNSIIENTPKVEEDTSKKEDKIEEKAEEKEPINLSLNIEVNGKTYIAKLEDNDTTRALIKKLPLELTMNELNGNEKYYRFDTSLPSNPININKINKGDIMLYEDNTLVIFYDSFDTIYKYTKIGTIEENGMLKTNLGKKEIKVKFSQSKK